MMKKKTALTITALSALCMACMIVLNADAVSAKRIKQAIRKIKKETGKTQNGMD